MTNVRREEKEREVEKIIEGAAREYHLKQFKGALPERTIELFKKAFFSGIPSVHRQKASFAKKVATKRFDELTNYEAGKVINMILGTPTASVWDSFEDSLDDLELLEQTASEYNYQTKEFEKSMFKRREALRQMYGLDKSSVPFSLQK